MGAKSRSLGLLEELRLNFIGEWLHTGVNKAPQASLSGGGCGSPSGRQSSGSDVCLSGTSSVKPLRLHWVREGVEARLGIRALVLTSASMGVAQLSFIPLLLRSVAQSCPTLYHSSVQAPLFLGLFRQEYWSEWPFPSPRNLPDPGWNSSLLSLLHWQAESLPLAPRRTPPNHYPIIWKIVPWPKGVGCWSKSYT